MSQSCETQQATVFRFEECMDTVACEQMETDLLASIADDEAAVVFDLAGVKFVSSAFLGLCVRALPEVRLPRLRDHQRPAHYQACLQDRRSGADAERKVSSWLSTASALSRMGSGVATLARTWESAVWRRQLPHDRGSTQHEPVLCHLLQRLRGLHTLGRGSVEIVHLLDLLLLHECVSHLNALE